MRTIISKYAGDCRRCGATIPAGASVVYERRVGIFCPGCAPIDPEEIRALRQEGANRKADRYDAWAEKREKTAGAVLSHIQEHYRGDYAFNTQPGHIPERARVIRREDRAFESLNKARSMRARADSLRHVVVAGDAERRREVRRAVIRSWIEKGMTVSDAIYGLAVVLRVNKKTATIRTERSGFEVRVELSHLRRVNS